MKLFFLLILVFCSQNGTSNDWLNDTYISNKFNKTPTFHRFWTGSFYVECENFQSYGVSYQYKRTQLKREISTMDFLQCATIEFKLKMEEFGANDTFTYDRNREIVHWNGFCLLCGIPSVWLRIISVTWKVSTLLDCTYTSFIGSPESMLLKKKIA